MREAPAIRFRLVREGARLPQRATPESGAFDIFAPQPGTIRPGERQIIGLGIAHEIPESLNMEFREDETEVEPGEMPRYLTIKFHALLIGRSGLAAKYGVKPFHEPALIDNDYRGEIKAVLWNGGDLPYTWQAGERLVQIMYLPFFMGRVVESAEPLTPTERGQGGLGSTGK